MQQARGVEEEQRSCLQEEEHWAGEVEEWNLSLWNLLGLEGGQAHQGSPPSEAEQCSGFGRSYGNGDGGGCQFCHGHN